MSTRKQRRKAAREGSAPEEGAPVPAPARKAANPAPPPEGPVDPAEEWRNQRMLSVVGFALCGLLMGFLAGANQPIEVSEAGSAVVQAARIGAAVASHTAEWGRGVGGGLMGLAVGGTFGYSLFLAPLVMFLSWLGGGLGLAAGLATGIALVGGLGWVGGFMAVLLTALKVRLGGG